VSQIEKCRRCLHCVEVNGFCVNKCSGLDASGNSVGAPARFTVETFSAGKGELDVTVINPNGIQEPVCLVLCANLNAVM